MKTLNNYFSNIYCINLDKRPDRYEDCLIEFKLLNINVERVSGVDGTKLYREGMGIGVGNYGLVQTQMKIINDAINKKYKSFLLLEDDVMFIDGFYDKFEKKINSLPDDWDLLYLGGNNLFHMGKHIMITGDKNFVITKDNYKMLDYELCKTTWTQCAHAVAINSRFYQTLLNKLNENQTTPGDLTLARLQAGCNAYTFLPSLVLQRPSFSDINFQFVNFNEQKDTFNF
jgi:GR25 family glycosyltransferase involved in LPS biosynthesis